MRDQTSISLPQELYQTLMVALSAAEQYHYALSLRSLDELNFALCEVERVSLKYGYVNPLKER